jgi:hypothetical protein
MGKSRAGQALWRITALVPSRQEILTFLVGFLRAAADRIEAISGPMESGEVSTPKAGPPAHWLDRIRRADAQPGFQSVSFDPKHSSLKQPDTRSGLENTDSLSEQRLWANPTAASSQRSAHHPITSCPGCDGQKRLWATNAHLDSATQDPACEPEPAADQPFYSWRRYSNIESDRQAYFQELPTESSTHPPARPAPQEPYPGQDFQTKTVGAHTETKKSCVQPRTVESIINTAQPVPVERQASVHQTNPSATLCPEHRQMRVVVAPPDSLSTQDKLKTDTWRTVTSRLNESLPGPARLSPVSESSTIGNDSASSPKGPGVERLTDSSKPRLEPTGQENNTTADPLTWAVAGPERWPALPPRKEPVDPPGSDLLLNQTKRLERLDAEQRGG